jgi:hypothetical protein
MEYINSTSYIIHHTRLHILTELQAALHSRMAPEQRSCMPTNSFTMPWGWHDTGIIMIGPMRINGDRHVKLPRNEVPLAAPTFLFLGKDLVRDRYFLPHTTHTAELADFGTRTRNGREVGPTRVHGQGTGIISSPVECARARDMTLMFCANCKGFMGI